MKNINDNVFFNKILQRINNGDFDTYFTIPFMTRDLFISSVKGRLDKKISSGGTPILSDSDLKDCLAETKETAAHIFAIYLKMGFIVKTEVGYEMTKIMQIAIKAAYRQ